MKSKWGEARAVHVRVKYAPKQKKGVMEKSHRLRGANLVLCHAS